MSKFVNLQPIGGIATQFIFMAVCKKIFMVLAISRTSGLNNWTLHLIMSSSKSC